MKTRNKMTLPAAIALAMFAAAASAHGALITGWGVHNGTSTVGGTPAAPTFTPGDNVTLMAPYLPITLDANGEFVKVSTTLTMINRTANLGANALNTQLRLGIFNGPAGPIVASDVPNLGFIIEYSTLGGLIREQTSAAQANPFTSPTNLTPTGTVDADSISGANPPPVTFELTITRNGGLIDLTGAITGGNHASTYTATGYSSATHPAGGSFSFNRIGLFLGNNVDATSASLVNSTVTTNVPEPAACLLAAFASIGGLTLARQIRRSGRQDRRAK